MSDAVVYSDTIIHVPPTHLHANPDNPRTGGPGDVTELAKSIREEGVLVPLLVRTAVQRYEPDHYIIDAGERRWTAGKVIQIDLPCRVGTLAKTVDPGEHSLVTGLVENGGRKDLSPIERAKAYGRLMKEFGYNQATLGQRLGIHPATISKTLNLLDLAPKTQQAVAEGKLSIADANRLVIQHREQQRKVKGQAPKSLEWQPPHLTSSHFLAGRARKLCDESDHDAKPVRLHGVACEFHWERVIRLDEAKVQQLASREAGFDVPFSSPEMAAASQLGHPEGNHR